MHCQWIVYSYTKSAEFVYSFSSYTHVNSLKNEPSVFFSFKMKHKQQQQQQQQQQTHTPTNEKTTEIRSIKL